MRAFLLAAGLGTRLRPLTDQIPKCLLPIGGRPMLEIWLRKLAACGVKDVLVNTHHHHEQVEEFARNWSGAPTLSLSFEPTLLGSAGTLRQNQEFVKGRDSFYVCYADSLTQFDIAQMGELFKARRAENPLGVIALHRSPEPRRSGIVDMDDAGWIQSFVEKPQEPKSNLANSGLYVFAQEAMDFLSRDFPSDIGMNLMPRLVPRLLGIEMDRPFIDIGTIDAYRKVVEAGF